MTRCRMPPDSSCGYWFIRASASGIPTRLNISTARACACALETGSCVRMISITCMPILNTGFNDVIGSWKIMLIWLPRTFRISSHESFSRSRPLK